MIPSSPGRLWTFLLLSLLAFSLPDLLIPDAARNDPGLQRASQVYLGALVTALFWFGPALCRAMVRRELNTATLALTRPAPTLVLFEHPAPYVLTVGLWPRQCRTFLSSGLAGRLTPPALAFLLGRAEAHGQWPHRLAAYLPVLACTVLIPNDPSRIAWPPTLAGLAAWLALHWFMELRADRQAAQSLGVGAPAALAQLELAVASRVSWLNLHPPRRWRERAVQP
jgi:Zn-dependent protease with chaperone function